MRLIDADANIETMKKCAENPEDKYALLCYRYAQRVLEEAPTVEPASPWHRVEEPPKQNGRYLISWEGAVTPDEYKNGVWLYASMFNLRFTHWMPLPEPPKEDADANERL